MKLILILMLLFVVLLPTISASTIFEHDTQVNQGNINYIFKKGVEIDNFKLFNGGIIIDEDFRLAIQIQGGSLDINIYKFDGINSEFSFKSSVPQTLIFNIIVNSKKYYLYDNSTYSLDSYKIGINELFWTVETLGNVEEKELINEVILINSIKKQSWYQKKIFEFEINPTIDENGIITARKIGISYFYFFVFILALILIGSLLWKLKK